MSKVRCGSACPQENMRLWLRLLQVLDARSANGRLLPQFLFPSGESKPYHVNCRGNEWHEIRTPSRSIDVRWRRSENQKKRENGDRRRRNRLSNLRNQKGMQPPINEINPPRALMDTLPLTGSARRDRVACRRARGCLCNLIQYPNRLTQGRLEKRPR